MQETRFPESDTTTLTVRADEADADGAPRARAVLGGRGRMGEAERPASSTRSRGPAAISWSIARGAMASGSSFGSRCGCTRTRCLTTARVQAVMYGPLVLVGRLGTDGITAENRRAEPTKPRTVPEFKNPRLRRRRGSGRRRTTWRAGWRRWRARRSSSRRRDRRRRSRSCRSTGCSMSATSCTGTSKRRESGMGNSRESGMGIGNRTCPTLSRREWLKVVGVAGAASVVSGAVDATDAITSGSLPNVADGHVRPSRCSAHVHERRVRAAARRRVHEVQLRLPRAVRRVRRATASASSSSPTRTRTASTPSRMTRHGDRRHACASRARASSGPAARRRRPARSSRRSRRNGTTIEWDTVVEMPRPVKTVTTIIRDVPRGRSRSAAAARSTRTTTRYSAAIRSAPAICTGPARRAASRPRIAVVQASDQDFFSLSSLDARVRPKRFYFQPGERGYRVEAIYEHDAWRNDTRVTRADAGGWARDVARRRARAAHGTRRAGVRPAAVGNAHRRAAVDAQISPW